MHKGGREDKKTLEGDKHKKPQEEAAATIFPVW